MSGSAETVIAAIYDAVLRPEAWKVALEGLAQWTGATDALLLRQEPDRQDPSLLAAASWTGVLPILPPLPADEAPPRRISAGLPGRSTPAPFVIAGLTGVDGLGCTLLLAEATDAQADLARLQPVLAHLRRAVALSLRTDTARADLAASSFALDSLSVPAFVLSANGAVRRVNRAGQRLALRGPAISIKDGKLAARRRHEHVTLRRVISEVVAGPDAAHKIFNLRSRQGNPVISVLVARVPGERDLLLVLVSDLMTRRRFNMEFCASQFGLTPAETRVAAAIAEGAQLAEIADNTGSALGTVRVHLRRIMAKTGAHSQAQLVGLLFQSLGMVELTA